MREGDVQGIILERGALGIRMSLEMSTAVSRKTGLMELGRLTALLDLG